MSVSGMEATLSSSSLCQCRRCSTRKTSLSSLSAVYFGSRLICLPHFATSFFEWSLHTGSLKITLGCCGFDGGNPQRDVVFFPLFAKCVVVNLVLESVLLGHMYAPFWGKRSTLSYTHKTPSSMFRFLQFLITAKQLAVEKFGRFLQQKKKKPSISTLHHSASVPLWLWLAASS